MEAEFLHEFVRKRSRGFAYPPIIACGINACVLHYLENDQPCNNGDLLLLDVAAEYANYNADMTRTIPVNGRYTDRQKAVYNAVLRVFRGAAAMLQPGIMLKDYQKEVGKMVEGELIGLGLLEADKVKEQDENEPLYRKYFMHGTSHHLGLDVHDVGAELRQRGVHIVEPEEGRLAGGDVGAGRLAESVAWTPCRRPGAALAGAPRPGGVDPQRRAGRGAGGHGVHGPRPVLV